MRELETKRLRLREPRDTDAAALLVIRNSEFVQRYNAMRLIDEEKLRGQLTRERERGEVLLLTIKTDDRPIGGIWVEEDSTRYDVHSRYLSYYLTECCARQGYMKEALSAVIDSLFLCDPSLELVASSVFPENTASERLLLSLGFTCEGCLRKAVRDPRGVVHDDKLFTLLREEWGR